MTPLQARIGFPKQFQIKDMFIDAELSAMHGTYVFDIRRFDDWLHKAHEYKEETHGSIRDFVQQKWGNSAVAFLEQAIGIDKS